MDASSENYHYDDALAYTERILIQTLEPQFTHYLGCSSSAVGVKTTPLTRRPDFQCPSVCVREKLISPMVFGVVSNLPMLICFHVSFSNLSNLSVRTYQFPSGRSRLRFTGISHPRFRLLIFTTIVTSYIVLGESTIVLLFPLISSQQIRFSSATGRYTLLG